MKEKFSAIKNVRNEIKKLEEKLQDISDALQRLTVCNDGTPKTPTRSDTMSALLATKLDLEKEVEERIAALMKMRIELATKLFADVSLSNHERKVLLLRYVDGLPFKEIARQMKYSENQIFLNHRRGLKKIS